MRFVSRLLFAFALMLFVLSCGGGSGNGNGPTVGSIIISPASATSQATFTASGQVGSTTLNPLSVSWVVGPFFFDQPGVQGLAWNLTPQPFTTACSGFHGNAVIAAWRPVDPDAPATGTITTQQAEQLISNLDGGANRTDQIPGFIASSSVLTCP